MSDLVDTMREAVLDFFIAGADEHVALHLWSSLHLCPSLGVTVTGLDDGVSLVGPEDQC